MPKNLSQLMDNAFLYRYWQLPFAKRKLKPILMRHDIESAQHVLDVGCGPGTNTPYFLRCAEYLGVDFNPSYIDFAKSKFGRSFIAADATQTIAPEGARFDFILINSLLHHLSDSEVEAVLGKVPARLSEEGHVHILDLVLPEKPCIAKTLASLDRGQNARSLEHWERLFSKFFQLEEFTPYPLGFFGVTLWNMVYFKGKRKPSLDT